MQTTNEDASTAPRAPRSRLRRAAGCGVWMVAIAFSGKFMIDALVRQMLYPVPPVAVPAAPPPLEEVRLERAQGDTIIGWYGAGKGPEGAGPATQVLFLHGNGENLATLRMAGVFEEFRELGIPVLAIDYPGYGRSGGKPSQEANTAAAVAACGWLAERDPDARRVIMGWSLGAAVGAQAAPRCRDVAGLVLASAWHDLESVARDHFPAILVRMAVSDRYDTGEALQAIGVPILMIHGGRDRLIPTRHGRSLRDHLEEAGRDVTWNEVPDAGHNDLMGRREVWRALADFLETGTETGRAPSGR